MEHLAQPRVIRQPLPDPPAAYDQAYIFRMVNALNLLMNQVTAQAEWVAARYIATDMVYVDPTGQDPKSVLNTKGLPTGLLYMLRNQAQALGTPLDYVVSVVKGTDV